MNRPRMDRLSTADLINLAVETPQAPMHIGAVAVLDGRVLRDAGFHWSATVIWVKDAFVLGRSQFHRRYEPIWYGWL